MARASAIGMNAPEARDIAKVLDRLGGIGRGFAESVPDRAAFRSPNDARARVLHKFLDILGPHARRNPEFLHGFSWLLKDSPSIGSPIAEAIVGNVLLPALALTQSNPARAEGLWMVFLCVGTRNALALVHQVAAWNFCTVSSDLAGRLSSRA